MVDEGLAVLVDLVSQRVQCRYVRVYVAGPEVRQRSVGHVYAGRPVLVHVDLVLAAERAFLNWLGILGAARQSADPFDGRVRDVRDLQEDGVHGALYVEVVVRVRDPLDPAPWTNLALLGVYDLAASRAREKAHGGFAAVVAPARQLALSARRAH